MTTPKIKPQFVYDGTGNIQTVLLSKKDFEKFVDSIEDYCDYYAVKDLEPIDLKDTIPIEEVEQELLKRKK